jgi:cellulose synthase operon protein C
MPKLTPTLWTTRRIATWSSGWLATALATTLMVGLAACGKAGPSEAELLASAKTMLEKKDKRGAIIQLKSALQINGDSAPTRLLLGKTLLETGDAASAVLELRKAQELQVPEDVVVPEIARAMLAAGDAEKVVAQYRSTKLVSPQAMADLQTLVAAAFATRGNLPNAYQAVDSALSLKPGYVPAMIVQARLAASEGRLDDALKVLDDVQATDANNDRANLLKGDILWRGKGDLDGAVVAFKKVLAAHPDSIAAMSSLANIYFQRKDMVQAKAQLETLKKAAPEHPETLFLDAQLALNEGNFKGAREIAGRLLKAIPDNLRALELAGAAEFRMRNFAQAESLLAQAVKASPRQVTPRQLLAQTHLRSGHAEKALEVLRPILESSQPDGSTLALAGEAYLETGDNKRSEEFYERALRIAPADARVRTAVALAQLARDSAGPNSANSTKAMAELEAIASDDSTARADLALISARLRHGDLAGALTAIDAVEKKLPNQALPLNLRGRVLLLKRDMAGAAKNFEAALAKEPGYFPAVASLADIDLSNNKPELARKRFEDQFKAYPNSFQSKVAMAELDARAGVPLPQVAGMLKDAIRIGPSEPGPHLALINRLLSGGDGKAAMAAAQDAMAALPANLDIQDAMGRAELAAGDGQRAVSTFKKLASQQPRNPMHEVHLADAYMQLQDRVGAGAALRRAAELQPQLVAPQRGLVMLALANQKPTEALAIARKLQQISPKNAAGFSLEGDIETRRKNWDAAVVAYRSALSLERNGDSVARLHSALTSAGKTSEADKLAGEWQKDSPKDTLFTYYLGDVAMAQSNFAQAESRYRAVLEVQPNNALALNNVAWLLVKQGKPGALALAERATSLLVDRPALLDTLALAQEAENQLPKAIETQKRAIALAQDDPVLRLRLAKLFIKQGDKASARTELEGLSKLGEKFAGQDEATQLLRSL